MLHRNRIKSSLFPRRRWRTPRSCSFFFLNMRVGKANNRLLEVHRYQALNAMFGIILSFAPYPHPSLSLRLATLVTIHDRWRGSSRLSGLCHQRNLIWTPPGYFLIFEHDNLWLENEKNGKNGKQMVRWVLTRERLSDAPGSEFHSSKGSSHKM